MRAADHQCRAGDTRQLFGHRRIREHAIDRGEALRIVGNPARMECAELLGIMADLGRIGVGETLFNQRPHTLRLGGCGAIERCLAAIGSHAGGRAGHHQRAGTRRMTHREVDGDGAADRGAGERDLALDPQRIEQCGDIVRHVVERDAALDLLRQSRAARVVAQHLARVVQRRQHLVPTVQRAAHLVHQDQRGLATAG